MTNLDDPIRERQSRTTLARIRIKLATTGNELCNGIRLLQLNQVREAYDKWPTEQRELIRSFFLNACDQSPE